MTRHDPTDTVFSEVHGDPFGVIRIAVQVQGAGFHPDDDPREVIDADGLRVWDDADAAEIDVAISLLGADGVDVYDLTFAYLKGVDTTTDLTACCGAPTTFYDTTMVCRRCERAVKYTLK